MLIRLILLAALVYVVWRVLRNLREPLPPPGDPEPMAQCGGCGVYVPRSTLQQERCERCRR